MPSSHSQAGRLCEGLGEGQIGRLRALLTERPKRRFSEFLEGADKHTEEKRTNFQVISKKALLVILD